MTTALESGVDTLVFSAWSAVSPFGVGSAAFAEGVRAGASALAPSDGPFPTAALVPDFSAQEALGRKGTRSMDRVTALAVSTVGRLLEECGPDLLAQPDRVGVVLGTGSGSVQSIMDFTRDALTGDKPYHVDPALFPNTVMNRAAGQSAIWHKIKGPNTTIAGGALTGLLALSYATRLLRGGHCDRVLVGAAEEYSTQRAWLEWRGSEGSAAPLGEGGAVFLLESEHAAAAAGRPVLARPVATRFRGFFEPSGAGAALTTCVRSALAEAGVAADDIAFVSTDGAHEDAVVEALGRTPEWVRCAPLVGDTSAAAASFQLAAAVATGRSGHALVTGVESDGTVGCTVLELP
ncbi:beta-ketoacyl synthase N-terminal-like domain-containing protein [Actinosynnema sp. NPDC047251]|uniref:Beta-ketoacyl synthase I n=1 Tax=Saccharothrix espanaensis (strain ATCC 51144 / DSM 44229 / JCM 9112 / NBRC 15066 / NRRL 15764) TaxID=1179773 RepID=K0JWW1_SACES|nr:beta-ketoacyl synthase N-terminal-like domain-containing protein [Saccharothrix espanaensis]CCH30531.1 beta-ketoacyl synthase I [Saccharothrix espanaensis DSM 44229]